MRISLGDTSISNVMTGTGPIAGCLQNTPAGMYYVPRANDPTGFYDANAPLCFSDIPAQSAAPAIVPSEPPPSLPELPTLTPLNITQPLPAISSTLAPAPLQTLDLWCEINSWIDNNPLWAAAILAAGAFFGLRKKGGAR